VDNTLLENMKYNQAILRDGLRALNNNIFDKKLMKQKLKDRGVLNDSIIDEMLKIKVHLHLCMRQSIY